MDKQTLESTLLEVGKNLVAAREKLFLAAAASIEAQSAYEDRLKDVFLSGDIDGKDEETRKAQVRAAADKEVVAMRGAEVAERIAKFEYDVAAIEMHKFEMLLRIAELK